MLGKKQANVQVINPRSALVVKPASLSGISLTPEKDKCRAYKG